METTLKQTSTYISKTRLEELRRGDRIIIDHYSQGEKNWWEFGKFLWRNKDGKTFTAKPLDPDDRRTFLKQENFENTQYFDKVSRGLKNGKI
jgi:hypothetical protein